MANKARKQEILYVCQELDILLDDMFPRGMEFEHSRYGLSMTARFKDTLAIVSLYFAWDKPMSDVRIMFLGGISQYTNRKLNLREKISQKALEELEHICIAREQFPLYMKQHSA